MNHCAIVSLQLLGDHHESFPSLAPPNRGCALRAGGHRGTAADRYPSKPVRLIGNYPPSGVVDRVARAMSDRLTSLLGLPGGEGLRRHHHRRLV